MGNNTYARWKKSHQTKTLLDKISESDIAYTILVFENSKEVWEEELSIKARVKTDEERKHAEQHHNPRYHETRGKRLKRYGDGCTEEGRKYYKELLTTFQDLKSSEFWNESLQGYWNEYQIRNWGRLYGTRMETNVFVFTLFFSPPSLFSWYDIVHVPINLGK